MALPAHLSQAVLGYRLHTNRELGLMLRRQKPLAVFSEVNGEFAPVLRRYLRLFDHRAAHEAFLKQLWTFPLAKATANKCIHVLLYALPEEGWRIEAMIALKAQLYSGQEWTAQMERREGLLLGYSEAECDLWFERRDQSANRN